MSRQQAGGQPAIQKVQGGIGLVKDRHQPGCGGARLGTAGGMDEQVGGMSGSKTYLRALRQPQHLADQFVTVKQACVDGGADRIQPQDGCQQRRR